MHPQAIQLADTFKRDFFSADHSIRWRAAEEESYIWLDPQTVLAGTVDARGYTEDNESFFADWKTIGVRSAGKNNCFMPNVKAAWRMDPQALCYGLLLSQPRYVGPTFEAATDVVPATNRFCVRWAVKSTPPTTDFEWYTYEPAELEWWKRELLDIAEQIRGRRFITDFRNNWPTNLTACARYGWNLRCPLYDRGCSKLDFTFRPPLPARDHHKSLEDRLQAECAAKGWTNSLVVLSSSSVETFLACQQKYNAFYEGDGLSESGEALTIGTDFHTIIADHIRSLIKT